ncbi:MAG: hypothetical protein Q9172_005456 [Xanthocarpia lactea]
MLASISKPEGIPGALMDRPTQNQPSTTMQLRDRRMKKAPKRYVDELEQQQEDEGGQSQNPPLPSARHGAYRGPVIEFNPDLTPAAFPTLDPRGNNALHPSSHVHTTQHKNSADSSASSTHQKQQERSPSEANLNHQSMDGTDPRLIPEFRQTDPNHLVMNPFMGAPLYDTSNGPDNPIWRNNMRIMEDMGKMTDEELIMAEMATSDEDEEPKINGKHPNWDDIPLALRIEMIVEASGDDTVIEPALHRLRLTEAQKDAAIEDYRRHLASDDEEDTNIAEHQKLMNEALLNGPKAYSSVEGFRAVAAVHLYKNLDRPEVTVRRADVGNARDYMIYCGLNTSFLDSWVEPQKSLTESFGPSMSSRQATSNGNAVEPSGPPHPSTPIPPPLSNGTMPEVTLTPAAQRHQTPTALSPIPLRLDTPAYTQPFTKSSTVNHLSSRQSTSSTIEVDLNGKGPLQDMRANLLAANRILENGNSILQGSSPSYSPMAATGPTTQAPYSPPIPSLPSNGNFSLPDHEGSASDFEPQAKRKRPNISTKKPAAATSNEASESAALTSNGTSQNMRPVVNGTKTATNGATRNKPLPYEPSAKRSTFNNPMDTTNGAVQPMTPSPSATTEGGSQIDGTTGKGGLQGNGLIARAGEGNEVVNGTGDTNGAAEKVNGKKKVGRPRKVKV